MNIIRSIGGINCYIMFTARLEVLYDANTVLVLQYNLPECRVNRTVSLSRVYGQASINALYPPYQEPYRRQDLRLCKFRMNIGREVQSSMRLPRSTFDMDWTNEGFSR